MGEAGQHEGGNERGMSLLELMVGMTLALIVLLAVYGFIDWSKKNCSALTDLASAQAAGRAALDIFSSEAMVAGYSPLGVPIEAVPQGDAYRVRFLSDLNGNGTWSAATEIDEDVTYVFTDPDDDGVYELMRGYDFNGDGDFTDTDESVDCIAENIVPIDFDGDASTESFIVYDTAAPDTRRLQITFGVRTSNRDLIRGDYIVVNFRNDVVLRNRQ